MVEEVVEGVREVEGLRHGDAQVHIALAAHGDAAQEQHHAGGDQGEQHRHGQVARRAGQARRHDQEDGGDVSRPARRAAEPDQGEGARHGDPGPHAAVHHEDDRGHDDGQHHQGEQEAPARRALPGEGQGREGAADPRHQQAEQIDAHGKASGQNAAKD